MDFGGEVTGLRERLTAAGTVERAIHEKAYLKSDLEFLGTSVPAVRQIAKDFWRSHPNLSHDDLLALVEALWQTPVHEMRSVGIGLLELYGDRLSPADLPFVETLLNRANTWAHIDWLVVIPGKLLAHHPQVQQVLERWAKDENFWVRRSALLSWLTLAKRDVGSFQQFAQLAVPMLQEKEFFIRKAIAWVLRETSKKHPQWVYEFLLQHIGRVSGLTLREGGKYLPPEQFEELKALHQQRQKS